jgi:hypothetical protein
LLDSNIANLGSDLEKKVREAAAQTEAAWKNAGKKVGLEIWRIEKFQGNCDEILLYLLKKSSPGQRKNLENSILVTLTLF